MMSQAPIYVIDDDKGIRDSMSAMLGAYSFECETFDGAASFKAAFTGKQPVCLLVDKNLDDGNGLDIITYALDKAEVPVAAIMITGHGDVDLAVKAMQRGAVDFVEKPIDPDRVMAAIELAQKILRTGETRLGSKSDETKSALIDLSKREIDVLKQLAQGHPNKVVAYELGISPRTVEVHRARIMKKTGAQNFAELLRMAIAENYI